MESVDSGAITSRYWHYQALARHPPIFDSSNVG
jgi:hypothetical protein